jgi:hypothetical protein
MAIGGIPFSECLVVHTEDPADGPHTSGAAPVTPKTHHARGRSLRPIGRWPNISAQRWLMSRV